MVTTRRPSMADRALSTPPPINTLLAKPHIGRAIPPSKIDLNILTPPPSPRHSRSSSDLSTNTDDSQSDSNLSQFVRRGSIFGEGRQASILGNRTLNGTLICSYEVEILKDSRGRAQTFGCGAWSTVFKGTCHSKPTSGVLTPPLSPSSTPPVLVAVKQPARKDAKAILENEANVLSYLMAESGNEDYVVRFHGVILSTSSLVLAAIPLTLEDHIKKSAITAQASRSTWNMSEPVVGNDAVWFDLALKLVSALSWLHDTAGVIHGDIKPGNILLETSVSDGDVGMIGVEGVFPYQPLFADFSSSQRVGSAINRNTLSALTREYAAPELLSSKVLSNPESTATKASDVFSLAVTLLVAATGNTMVYSGSIYQRQAMATQGWMVIQSVRNGPMEEGARVPRQGVVERLLDRAVLRENMGRIDAAKWVEVAEAMMKAEPSKL